MSCGTEICRAVVFVKRDLKLRIICTQTRPAPSGTNCSSHPGTAGMVLHIRHVEKLKNDENNLDGAFQYSIMVRHSWALIISVNFPKHR